MCILDPHLHTETQPVFLSIICEQKLENVHKDSKTFQNTGKLDSFSRRNSTIQENNQKFQSNI